MMMKSLHICSLTKASSLPSLPPIAHVTSPASAVLFRKNERWRSAEEPMISQRWCLTRRHCPGLSYTNFAAHSREESDSYLAAENASQTFQRKLDVFYRFVRPHTIFGTVFIIISASLLSVEKLSDISLAFLIGLVQAIVAAVFMHVYVVGLNQVTDIEIDKVNKPDRPLVTGEFSINTAVIIILSFAVMSFGFGWIIGSGPLFCGLLAHFALGTAYSINVPFLRWKRYPFTATLCILGLQVMPSPLAFYLHMQTFVLGRAARFPKAIIIGTGILSIFSVSLSIFKDIPDIEGDKLDGIQSLAVRMGSKKVFWICIGLFQLSYLLAILVGFASPNNWSKGLQVSSHLILALILWSHAKSVDLGSNRAIEYFHMFLWRLFFAENILMRLLR